MLKVKTTAGVFLGLVAASAGWIEADPPKLTRAAAPVIEAPVLEAPLVEAATEASSAEAASVEKAKPIAPIAEAGPQATPTAPAPTRSSQVGVPYRSHGEPGWVHGVIRVGEEREAIKSLPMTERPYRPLHFYGNTVRRMHYRGTALPAPRDVFGAGAATILRK